jgi:hypothetical protein
MVQVVDIDAGEDIAESIAAAIDFDGLAVVIARGKCILV